MKFVKKISVVSVLILVGFILYTLLSTGFFRQIKPVLDGQIIDKVAIKGAEDIIVSRSDSFALISSNCRCRTCQKQKHLIED